MDGTLTLVCFDSFFPAMFTVLGWPYVASQVLDDHV